MRQSCSVVLFWYGTISYTQPEHKYKDRLRTNMIFIRSLQRHVTRHLTGAAVAAAARGSAYRRVEHRRLRSKQSATATAATRAESCSLLLLEGWTAAGRQDRRVVLCQNREMYVYEGRQSGHKYKDRLRTDTVLKRFLQFTPPCHTALDRRSSGSSSSSEK